jgi:hypothetical protein
MIVPCYAKPTKKPTSKTPRDGEMDVPLSSVQSLYECRAEVIITYTSSTPDACETHAQPVEESTASPGHFGSAEDSRATV